MNIYNRICNILLETPRDPSFSRRRRKWQPKKEEKPKETTPKSVLVGTSRSCDAAGGCEKVHPGKTHWKHIYGSGK